MSSMLDQAIVDAAALKEAALKNAEAMVVEKYSDEIKSAVNTLLSEEDEFGGEMMDDLAGDDEEPSEWVEDHLNYGAEEGADGSTESKL